MEWNGTERNETKKARKTQDEKKKVSRPRLLYGWDDWRMVGQTDAHKTGQNKNKKIKKEARNLIFVAPGPENDVLKK